MTHPALIDRSTAEMTPKPPKSPQKPSQIDPQDPAHSYMETPLSTREHTTSRRFRLTL